MQTGKGAGGRSCFSRGTKTETNRNIALKKRIKLFIGSLTVCKPHFYVPCKELLQSHETLPVNEAANYWIMSLCKHCPASPVVFHHLPFSIASEHCSECFRLNSFALQIGLESCGEKGVKPFDSYQQYNFLKIVFAA